MDLLGEFKIVFLVAFAPKTIFAGRATMALECDLESQ